ncbi:MAG: hypothetical protein ACJ8C4_14070 [Gemmataceae bacterium]
MVDVRCDDCGFLGLRNLETGQLDEADEPFLRDGTIRLLVAARGGPAHDALPICAKGITNFRDRASPGRPESILQAITIGHVCDGYAKRRKGHTPKDHDRMELAEAARADNERRDKEMREWQRSQKESDQKWQEEQRREDLRWRADQEAKTDSRFRQQMRQGNWQIIVVGILAALLMASASIVGSLIQVGRLFPPSKP